MTTLSGITGLLVFGVVVVAIWFVLKARLERERALGGARLQSELAVARAHAEESARRNTELTVELADRSTIIDALRAELSQSQQDTARLAAEVAAERRSAAEKLVLLSQAEVRMRDAFSALSSEALRQNNRSFLELATTSLGEFQEHRPGVRRHPLAEQLAARVLQRRIRVLARRAHRR